MCSLSKFAGDTSRLPAVAEQAFRDFLAFVLDMQLRGLGVQIAE